MATLEPITRIEQFLNDIIEQGGGGGGGSGGGGLVVTVTNDVLDKTWNEINAARLTGAVVLNGLTDQSGYSVVAHLNICASEDDYYFVEFFYMDASQVVRKSYASESATGQMISDD